MLDYPVTRFDDMEYMTAKDAAEKWGISERRVQVLCEQGRIEKIARLGKSWAIPKDAKKPLDARRKGVKSRREDVN